MRHIVRGYSQKRKEKNHTHANTNAGKAQEAERLSSVAAYSEKRKKRRGVARHSKGSHSRGQKGRRATRRAPQNTPRTTQHAAHHTTRRAALDCSEHTSYRSEWRGKVNIKETSRHGPLPLVIHRPAIVVCRPQQRFAQAVDHPWRKKKKKRKKI